MLARLRRSNIAAGVLASYANTAVGILANFIAIPLYLRFLGRSEYGLWLAISGITSYLGLLNLGIAQTASNLVGRSAARRDDRALATALTTGFLLYARTVALAIAVLWVAGPLVPWGRLLHSPAPLNTWQEAKIVIVAATAFLFELPFTLLPASLRAVGGLGRQQGVAAVQTAVRVAGAIIYLRMGGGLMGLIIFLAALNVASHLAAGVFLARRCPVIVRQPGRFDAAMARDMRAPSGYYLLLQVGGAVLLGTDSIVIATILGARVLPPYSIAQRLTFYGYNVIGALATSYGPAFLEAHARGDVARLRSLYRRAMMLCGGGGGVGAVALFLVGPFFIRWWVGSANYVGFTVLGWLCLFLFIQALLAPADALLVATGCHQRYALAGVWEACLNLGLSILLCLRFGVSGVIAGSVIARILGAGSVMLLASERLLRNTGESVLIGRLWGADDR